MGPVLSGSMTELRRGTHHIAAPHHLLVTDVETYARDSHRPGTIEHRVATEGIVYERAVA